MEKNMLFCPPEKNCTLCPRLKAFREENKLKYPLYHNGSVEPFGALTSQILVVGLAPGLNGANKTNRPFTNDYAGDILYPALEKYGLAQGTYQKRKDDGFELLNTRVTNAVRCVPPQNKVTGAETAACGKFLKQEIESMLNLKIILSLGTISHNAVLKALGIKQSAFKFGHGATHRLPNGKILIDSYHTSRYNINTGVLTAKMFDGIISLTKELLENV